MDYGSPDDSDDDNENDVHGVLEEEEEEDAQGANSQAELSRRTNDLMDNFRSYVSDMGDDDDVGGGEDCDIERGGGAAVGAGSLSAGDVPLLAVNHDNSSASMLRDFTIDGENENDDNSSAEYGGGGSPVHIKTARRYRYSWLQSKRVKRGFGTIALASIIVAVVAMLLNYEKRRGLPDWNWNEELNEMMQDEKDRNDHHVDE